MADCPSIDILSKLVDVLFRLVLSQQFVCGWIEQMIQSHLDVLLDVDAHWSQVLVGVGDDDRLVFLEGG